jgi:hypothetical protein
MIYSFGGGFPENLTVINKGFALSENHRFLTEQITFQTVINRMFSRGLMT